MANIKYAVIFHNANTDLSKDDAVCTLHFEVGAPDTVEGTADDIAAAFQGDIAGNINGNYSGSMTIKAYPGAGGDPIGSWDYTPTFTGPQSPTEVCLCLSYMGQGSAPKRQRMGRIYVPVGLSTWYADSTVRAHMISLGQAIASAGSATFSTWKQYSPTSGQWIDVTTIWCDDAPDTQRRRGYKATVKTQASVQ